MKKVFIGIYTHECKSYCDEQFFSALKNLTYKNKMIEVVDNSLGIDYYSRLIILNTSETVVKHINVDRTDKTTLFHRNVYESVKLLREDFLATDCDYFLVFETDVIMPPNAIEMFMEVVDKADIIGGLYMKVFILHKLSTLTN